MALDGLTITPNASPALSGGTVLSRPDAQRVARDFTTASLPRTEEETNRLGDSSAETGRNARQPRDMLALSTLEFAESTRRRPAADGTTVADDRAARGNDRETANAPAGELYTEAADTSDGNLSNTLDRLVQQRDTELLARTRNSTPPGEIPPDAPVPDMPSPAPIPLPDDPTNPQPEPGNPLPVQTPTDTALSASRAEAQGENRADALQTLTRPAQTTSLNPNTAIPTDTEAAAGAPFRQNDSVLAPAASDAIVPSATPAARVQTLAAAAAQTVSALTDGGDQGQATTGRFAAGDLPAPAIGPSIVANNAATNRLVDATQNALSTAYRAAFVDNPPAPLTDIIVGQDTGTDIAADRFPASGAPLTEANRLAARGDLTGLAPPPTATPQNAAPRAAERTGPTPAGNPDATRIAADRARPDGIELRPAAGNLEPYMYYGFLALTPPSAPAATSVTQAVAGGRPASPPELRPVSATVDVLNRNITQRFTHTLGDAVYDHDGTLGSPALRANVATLLRDNPSLIDDLAFERALRDGLVNMRI